MALEVYSDDTVIDEIKVTKIPFSFDVYVRGKNLHSIEENYNLSERITEKEGISLPSLTRATIHIFEGGSAGWFIIHTTKVSEAKLFFSRYSSPEKLAVFDHPIESIPTKHPSDMDSPFHLCMNAFSTAFMMSYSPGMEALAETYISGLLQQEKTAGMVPLEVYNTARCIVATEKHSSYEISNIFGIGKVADKKSIIDVCSTMDFLEGKSQFFVKPATEIPTVSSIFESFKKDIQHHRQLEASRRPNSYSYDDHINKLFLSNALAEKLRISRDLCMMWELNLIFGLCPEEKLYPYLKQCICGISPLDDRVLVNDKAFQNIEARLHSKYRFALRNLQMMASRR